MMMPDDETAAAEKTSSPSEAPSRRQAAGVIGTVMGTTVAAGMVGATLPTAADAPTEPEGDEEWEI